MSKLKKLITEIHRRSLWQVLLIYIGAAWACFELIATVAETMGLPGWLPGLAIVLFLLALPIVLATAFVREDVLATQPAAGAAAEVVDAHHEARRKRRALTWRNAGLGFVAVLAVWGVVAAGWMLFGGGEPETGAVAEERPSLAVLPLVNRSGVEEDAYFTDGIHDELLTQLSKISGLSVRARTSVMEYRDSPKNIRQIGEELNARYLLEGGVQRAGGTVRINVQLVDSKTDEHVFADTYDRELSVENLLGVQRDLALRIADALRATLSARERGQLEEMPTHNLEAYDYYLRGLDYAARNDNRIATEMFGRAVELDSEFALAHAQLSMVHSSMYWYQEDGTAQRLALAKEAADRALAINPDLPQAHLALGLYYYRGYRDYDRALNELSVAEVGYPYPLVEVAAVERRRGNWERAVDIWQSGFERDPRNYSIAEELGRTFLWLRRYPEAQHLCEQAITLRPEIIDAYGCLVRVYLMRDGNVEEARAVLESGMAKLLLSAPDASGLLLRQTQFDLYEGKYRAALEGLSSAPIELMAGQRYYYPNVLVRARVYTLMGESELARADYDSSRVVLESAVAQRPDDHRIHSALGITYAGLGRKEDALQHARLAVELLPVSKDALDGTWPLKELATVLAMTGEYDAAIERLDYLLSIPGEISVTLLRIDPTWDPLRNHPRFQALLTKYE